MQIELSEIKASPRPVRTSWDEGKMEELTASIVQRGVISPIKVREVGDVYEIIFGHRRVEASRRAGRSQIPAIVESLDDSHSMMQAIIENLQREDLGPMDTAKALQELKDISGLETHRVAKMLGMSYSQVNRYIQLLQEPLEIQELIARKNVADDDNDHCNETSQPAKITAHHVRLVRESGLDEEDRIKILQKAAEEGLTAKQARVEAEILKVYGTEEERKASDELYEKQEVQDKERSWWSLNASEGAKNLVRRIKTDREGWKHAWLIVEREALGPEHMPYIEKRLRSFGEYIISLADDLDKKRREAIE